MEEETECRDSSKVSDIEFLDQALTQAKLTEDRFDSEDLKISVLDYIRCLENLKRMKRHEEIMRQQVALETKLNSLSKTVFQTPKLMDNRIDQKNSLMSPWTA